MDLGVPIRGFYKKKKYNPGGLLPIPRQQIFPIPIKDTYVGCASEGLFFFFFLSGGGGGGEEAVRRLKWRRPWVIALLKSLA